MSARDARNWYISEQDRLKEETEYRDLRARSLLAAVNYLRNKPAAKPSTVFMATMAAVGIVALVGLFYTIFRLIS